MTDGGCEAQKFSLDLKSRLKATQQSNSSSGKLKFETKQRCFSCFDSCHLICISLCPSLLLSLCPSLCLSLCLSFSSVFLSVSLYVSLSYTSFFVCICLSYFVILSLLTVPISLNVFHILNLYLSVWFFMYFVFLFFWTLRKFKQIIKSYII